MPQSTWTAADRFVNDLLVGPDPELDAALEASAAAGLPEHQVSPAQGKLLHLLARAIGARTVLELGTLGGYSTIWLARALPADGRLVTLERDTAYAEVATTNIARAGFAGVVELRTGAALEILPQLVAEEAGRFDLIFVDADKAANPEYLPWALRLSRPGSLIVWDNVVRAGALADADSDDPKVRGQRQLHELLAAEAGVTTTTLQTVGEKGYDGFALSLVEAASGGRSAAAGA